MTESTIAELAPEPEETLEAALAARLAETCTIPVEGMLAPRPVGLVKRLSADTFVGVKVDQTSQDGDYRYRAPATYSAQITVRFALADGADGMAFRNECRRVRSALIALTGDGCAELNAATFACAEFMMDSTNTTFEDGEEPVYTKTYTATVKGRQINTET